VMITGLALFIFHRGTGEDLTIDTIFALVGVVCMIIPIVNMVTISLPRQTTAVGLGINTMLRNLGGAIGPVVATAIMTTYTVKGLRLPPGTPAPPSSTAFDIIFEIGIVLAVLVMVLAYASKNYTFKSNKVDKPTAPGAH